MSNIINKTIVKQYLDRLHERLNSSMAEFSMRHDDNSLSADQLLLRDTAYLVSALAVALTADCEE